MARDYDTQLLESVAVRRRRLRDALLFGSQWTRRTFDENVAKILAGLCVAAVICAGTVGWSFVKTKLLKQEKERAAQEQVAPPDDAVAPVPAEWVGAQVRFPMLRAALTRAGVLPSLYVLPGQPRPRPARVSSFYVIARDKEGFSGGIVEARQGRIAAQFPTEDEACRWLYGELAVREVPLRPVTPQEEQRNLREGAKLAADARSKIGSGSVTYPLAQGRLVDAFGQESGSTLFPLGTPFAQRGLPLSFRATVFPAIPASYLRYRVVKPFQVTGSLSVPGGGVRFTLAAGLFPRAPTLPSVRWLLRNGYLERVAGVYVPR